MLRNLFSSRASDLSPENAIELVNDCLELASKEDDIAKKLKLANSAKSLLKDAENIFAFIKVKDPALSESIAHAYHEHGRLLDALGHHDQAKKSHGKAEMWGYVDVVGRDTGSSHRLGRSGTIRRPVVPTAVLSVASSVVAVYRDSLKADVTQLNHQDHILHATPVKDGMQIQNITPPVAKYALPKPDELITSTPQLAYCLSLLHPSMISTEGLDQSERDWLQDGTINPDEEERLQTMATDLVRAFVQEALKEPDVVAEVVSLTAVLEQVDFRKLLQ
ncbi:hypothetical protein BGZ80_004637, partial [Entomortierella chlamydospora]